MKALYFDCFSGISGDMTLGALLDLGLDKDAFLAEMAKLNVEGFEIKIGRTEKSGIGAQDVDVILTNGEFVDEHHHHEHTHEHTHEHEHSHDEHTHEHHHDHEHTPEHEHHHDHEHMHEHDHAHTHEHSHEHTHAHVHRNINDIKTIIDNSTIADSAKDLAKRIFMRVAKAEAKVHGKTLEEVHFHEVGALDSIVDIIGTAVLIDMIKPDKIYASVVNDGHGFIKCQHGLMPVPAPATAEIFAASDVVYKQIDVNNEMVTPTGAAIIAELAESYGMCPQMNIIKTGYGAGKREFSIPNLLRVVLGEIDG